MAEARPAGRFDSLYLWFLGNPNEPRLVGDLRLLVIGKGVSLTYAREWVESGFALSENLPLIPADFEHPPYAPGMAAGAVDDARPDRWGERVIQFIDKPKRLSLMEYLYFAGDDRFGALGVSTSRTEYLPRRNGPLPRLVNAQAVAEAVRKINLREPLTAIESRMVSAGGSFGGAKPKALIEIDGSEWVIKFFANEPIDVPLVEHASMTLAAKAGIRVAETKLVPLTGENAVAVKRFDRRDGGRVHCISAGTALRALVGAGQPADLGYPNLAQLLRRAGETANDANQHEMRELFRRMVFNILIDNTDDHEKNHALMVLPAARGGKLRLSPAYDVLPTNSGQGHQEFVVGEQGLDATLTNAMSQYALFGMSAGEAAAEVVRVIEVVDTWQAHFRACGVTAADIASLAQRIDGEVLLAERRSFSSADHAAPRAKRRRGPFA